MSQQNDGGVIHDIGFQHYSGVRLGRGYIVRSLYVESLRGAYGLGRSAKSKVMPFLLLAAVTVPALIVALVAGLTKADKLPLEYTSYTVDVGTAVLVFVASQCPASVSRDLRFHVMPLYFSRPITRSDYVLAKLAAMASALFILMAVPQLVLYGGALLDKLSFWSQTRGVLAGLVGVALFAVVLGAIGLLIASITPKRGFGVAAIITVLVMLGAIASSLQALTIDDGHRSLAGYLGLISPFSLVDGVQVWALRATSNSPIGPPGTAGGIVFVLVTVAVVAACYALMQARYRRLVNS
jgi:ABC-2 type transport system permease protein